MVDSPSFKTHLDRHSWPLALSRAQWLLEVPELSFLHVYRECEGKSKSPLSKRNEAWDRLTDHYLHWWGGHFPKCHYKIVFTYHLKFPMTLMVWSASETQVMGRWTTTWRSVNTWSPGSEAFTKYSNTPVWSAKFGASLKGGLPVQKIKYTSTLKHYFSSVYLFSEISPENFLQIFDLLPQSSPHNGNF